MRRTMERVRRRIDFFCTRVMMRCSTRGEGDGVRGRDGSFGEADTVTPPRCTEEIGKERTVVFAYLTSSSNENPTRVEPLSAQVLKLRRLFICTGEVPRRRNRGGRTDERTTIWGWPT